jgi:hypothetical protein
VGEVFRFVVHYHPSIIHRFLPLLYRGLCRVSFALVCIYLTWYLITVVYFWFMPILRANHWATAAYDTY